MELILESGDNFADRILVTGGTGLIGKNLSEVLQNDKVGFGIKKSEKWIFIGSKDGDLRDRDVVRGLFEKYQPSIVLHLAAKVGGLYTNMAHNLEFFRDNLLMNDNILQCAFESGVKKSISCLSTCIFPDKTSYPIDEKMIHNGPPHESNFGYSYAKRMLDVQNRAYNQKFRENNKNNETNRVFTSIIPCNIFGKWDNFDLEESHVIPALIHKMYLSQKRGEKSYKIYGTGSPLRQFIYAEDLAKIIIGLIREYQDSEPIILSVDEKDEVPIRDVAQMIMNNFQGLSQLETNPAYADGQHKKTANNAKLRNFFPNFTFTPLEEAIRETVTWFKENYETARTGKI